MKDVLKGGKKMPFVKVLRHGQVTLPKEFREVLHINEGQILEAKLNKSGVLLKPKALVDSGTTLSAKGKEKVKEALEAYKKGKAKAFDNVDDLVQDLNS